MEIKCEPSESFKTSHFALESDKRFIKLLTRDDILNTRLIFVNCYHFCVYKPHTAFGDWSHIEGTVFLPNTIIYEAINQKVFVKHKHNFEGKIFGRTEDKTVVTQR